MTSKDVTLPLNLNVNEWRRGGRRWGRQGVLGGPLPRPRSSAPPRIPRKREEHPGPGWSSTKPTPLCRAAPALLIIIYLFTRSFIFPLMECYLLFRIIR